MEPQVQRLRKGVDILIATPGRLLDHVSQKTVDLSRVEYLVLDEADRMLDMGFIPDVRRILALLPKRRQSLFFSATFPDAVRGLAEGFLSSPKRIEAEKRNTPAPKIRQSIYLVDKQRKPELLAKFFHENGWQQVLVFVRMKHIANRLAEHLSKSGVESLAIHGNKSQSARTKALADFKQGKIRALVATDIAARGLDIEQLPQVVNYELPNVPADDVHRIGRTGRAGCEGEALSLVCVDEHSLLKEIEKFLKVQLARKVVSGFEPDLSIRPEPLFKRRQQPLPRRHSRKK
jgi:ATP-dependent RNA helicase RhlE